MLVLSQYRAIADYKGKGRTELTITAGQIVEVVEKREDGWWFCSGEDGGRQTGFVPATFLESIDDEEEEKTDEADAETYITTKKYDKQQPDEISFVKAAVVKVLEKSLDGWWKVGSDGCCLGCCNIELRCAKLASFVRALTQLRHSFADRVRREHWVGTCNTPHKDGRKRGRGVGRGARTHVAADSEGELLMQSAAAVVTAAVVIIWHPL